MSSAVEFFAVSKSYPIYAAPGDRLKELATFHRRRYHRDYWALRDLSFDVRRGETFCIVGENGCGKSTLLQICAGILQPTSGTVAVSGRVAALLELGAGFNPEFTGRQNVQLNAAILGLSAAQIDRRFPEIAEFAEIGEFIDQPVKTYSSGMVVRLAFAVAIHVDPEILLVDEALSVGDIYFRQRCLRKVHELRSRGVTILFVSHATAEVKSLGDRALWLDHGVAKALGETDLVVSQYLAAMATKDAHYYEQDVLHHPPTATAPPAEIVEGIPHVDRRSGDGRAHVIGIAVCDIAGRPIHVVSPDSTVVVRISVRSKMALDQPIVGVLFRNELGVDFAGANTTSEGLPLPPLAAGETCTVDFYVDIPTLYSTSLSFSPAVSDGTLERFSICDFIENAVVLEMSPPEGPLYGPFRFPCRVQVNTRLGAGAASL
ncbi:MAG TPA: ABC transporter ATP-binding protein [Bryobacteraceae bacterium]|nr:ABC transporter ATP-binding protein [Bryobacteraceae bacterium]